MASLSGSLKRVFGGFGLIPGALYPLRALILLMRRPRLWPYLLLPLLINLIVGGSLYGGLLYWGWQGFTARLVTIETQWSNLGTSLPLSPTLINLISNGFILFGQILLLLGLFLLIGFVIMQFGVLLGSPWYGKLSEQLERLQTDQLVIIEVNPWREICRALEFELKKVALFISMSLLLFSLNVLPALGTILTTLGSLTLLATLTALDFLDAPLERRRLRFRHKLRLVWGSFPASGSFSFACMVLISLPLLNFLTIPLCVAAGTLFACDRLLPRLDQATTE